MKVEYLKIQGNKEAKKPKPAELYRIGACLVLEDGKTVHRVALSTGQWKVLGEVAEYAAADEQRSRAGNTPVCDSCGLEHNTELDCAEVSDEDKGKVFERARDAQVAFWHALGELEAVVGADVDGTQDLNDTDIEQLTDILDCSDYVGKPDSCELCKNMGHACIDHAEEERDVASSDPVERIYTEAFAGEDENDRAKAGAAELPQGWPNNVCPECKGSKVADDDKGRRPCPHCDGEGTIA